VFETIAQGLAAVELRGLRGVALDFLAERL
jgi:hypothetical protein